MNPGDILELINTAFSGGTVTVVLKLILFAAISAFVYWLYRKFKQAQIDAADAETRKKRGDDQSSTGPDTNDIAKDGNAAEVPIDEIHRRKNP